MATTTLFSYVVHISISDKVMPTTTDDLPQATLIQCINSLQLGRLCK